MSKVKTYIKNRALNYPQFSKQVKIESKKLDLAVKLTELSVNPQITQKKLDNKINKSKE